jgi:hypothetical protein
MEGSGLLELFKTLTNKELKSLQDYLGSPYTAKIRYRSEAVILLKILQNYTKQGKLADLSKELALYNQICSPINWIPLKCTSAEQ